MAKAEIATCSLLGNDPREQPAYESLGKRALSSATCVGDASAPLGLRLRRTLGPLPQAAGDRRREPIPQCPGRPDNLTAVVGLVSHEIGQNVSDVERQIAPSVGRSQRNLAALLTAESEEAEDALATALECRDQLLRPGSPSVDATGHGDPQLLAQGLDPHAARIVNVAGDHADGATGRSRDRGGPQLSRQVLDQEDRHPIVGPPGVEDRSPKIRDHISTIFRQRVG
jgi:hypothetical protein